MGASQVECRFLKKSDSKILESKHEHKYASNSVESQATCSRKHTPIYKPFRLATDVLSHGK